ncbi:hypothetical protein SAMD00019534_119410 [Acytostelium subglobosum LB1]|uniref:hypothetical protein n=1 Tax=Acytostelium subglobosum LB1 TaxID=1410327 RepID=UPI0006448475|nr:hypothetical protein SAMD00019534_119410 [Acytostelium subglobosum LB1]GAM28765.1 hypothetical protein SAMD00019534_119410 [Acytostelium subglobosum LB1]|eukprot:XP_012748320.1 hypothetical protein SAMD00019534_119410 [Acytostelium subglobosum LB1]
MDIHTTKVIQVQEILHVVQMEATLDTVAENQWIIANLMTGNEFYHISGSSSDKGFTFTHDYGNNVGFQYYDGVADRCKTSCLWPPRHPTFSATANKMVMSNVNFKGFQQNDDPANSHAPICEINTANDWEPTNTVGTDGGVVTFKRISTPPAPIGGPLTFTNYADNTRKFTCQIPAGTMATFTCAIPPGTGYWTMLNSTMNIYHQYEPPFLSYSYLTLGATPSVTIVGGNFGIDASKIQVTFGLNDERPCTGVSFVVNAIGVAITCTPDFRKPDVLPIIVTVDGVSYRSYRVPFVYQNGPVPYLYTLMKPLTDQATGLLYAQKRSAGTYASFLGAFADANTFNFFNTIRTSGTEDNQMADYDTFMGINRTGGQFLWNNGPYNGQAMTPYGAPSVTADTSRIEYYINVTNSQLKPLITDIFLSILVQYANTAPLTKQPPFVGIPTSGATINVTVSNYGLLYSKVIATMGNNNLVVSTPDARTPQIKSLVIPPGYITSDIKLTVDGYTPAQILTTIGYGAPSITSYTTKTLTTGGSTTLQGKNFFNDLTNMTVTMDGVAIQIAKASNTDIQVTIPTGTGKHQLQVILGGVASSKFAYDYAAPTITNTNLDKFGVFVIQGTSFGNNLTALSIEGMTYTKLFIIEPHVSIGVLVSAPGNYTIRVNVDGAYSTPQLVTVTAFVPKVDTYSDIEFGQNGNVTLYGNFFVDASVANNNDTRSPIRHYSSVASTSVTDGAAGNITDVRVTIGGQTCTVLVFLSNKIVCLFNASVTPTNNFGMPIVFTILSTNQTFTQDIFYYYQAKQCPSYLGRLCNGQGTCDPKTGQCGCVLPYGSADCSVKMSTSEPPVTPVVSNTAVTSISSSSVSYDVGVEYIREVTTGGPSNVLSMRNAVWKADTSNPNKQNFIATFPNSTCVVDVTTTLFNRSQTVEFAGESMSISANSVKYLITITGFPFVSKLNSLQVVYRANAASATNQKASPCAKVVQTNDTDWYEIRSQNSILSVRFSKRAIVDGRYSTASLAALLPTDELYAMSSSVDKLMVLTAMEVPPFDKTLVVDPNVAMLLREDNDESICPSGGNKRTWLLPVIVASAVVGAIIIVVASILIVRRALMGRRLKDVVMTSINK